FHQWQANLRILELTQIKSVPHVPLSHPFVERLIGTLRREYLDHMLFWTTADLENKLLEFRTYFNNHRTHNSLEGRTPHTLSRPVANLSRFDDNRTVHPYIKHQWLRDSEGLGLAAVSGRPRQYFQRNHSVFRNYSAFRGISSFTPTGYGAIAGTIGSRNNPPENLQHAGCILLADFIACRRKEGFMKASNQRTRIRGLVLSIAVLSVIFSSSHFTLAQTTTTGQLIGQVTDPTGALVPQAKVELRDTATGAVRTTTTDSAGQYALAQIAPG